MKSKRLEEMQRNEGGAKKGGLMQVGREQGLGGKSLMPVASEFVEIGSQNMRRRRIR